MLIDLYRKYKPKVGSIKIKTLKQMWKVIADELQQMLNVIVTPTSCENRWKVLDRNYKKYVDNNNATGRGRKHFEFAEDMQELFGGKKKVHPELILASTAVQVPEGVIEEKGEEKEEITEPAETEKRRIRKNGSTIKVKRKNVLEAIRYDRKNYQEARLAIETEKLSVLKERNKILEQRNKILSKCTCFRANVDILE
ncbi:uncharacterized protein LOC116160610 [Photinus pyralis]|uniref:uncharacterized protein LOC116160610 n=1 Tax=Photinus pyralis TaxID=7054 RepID=UPI00126749D8|nr:uncharacterized protein LOC116160610 [Photinus pyralis]